MLFDLIGDLGGVKELIILSFGWFLFPMSEHSFIMKAAKHLFLARTSNKEIFTKNPHGKHIRLNKFIQSGLLTQSEIYELHKHKKVHIGKK
tara:strand:- start:518 stop:790 length:273 start_codon:yes stop_codon:yes gene_type:complete